MKKRILWQMVIIISLGLLCFGLNFLFMEDIYLYRIQNQMKDTYDSVENILVTSASPEMDIVSLSMTRDVEIITYTSNGRHKYSTRQRPALPPIPPKKPGHTPTNTSKHLYHGDFSPFERMMPQQMERIREKGHSIEVNYAEELDAYFLTLLGTLSNGGYVAIYKSWSGIQSGIMFSNYLIGFLIAVFLLFYILTLLYLSRRVVSPIASVSEIARKMSRLDFSERYEGTMQDEVGALGESINLLSERLEHTITELKEANSGLSGDIEKREQMEKNRLAFVSDMAHELKTPLALMAGYVEGLRENVAEDENARRFYLEVISEETAHMDAVVQKMLSLNEMVWGEQPLTIERFSITELIQKAQAKYRLSGEEIQFSCAEDVYVLGDVFRIDDVLHNYINNAIHHKKKDSLIMMELTKSEEKARVHVYNDGEQIEESELEKIWDSFYRTDKARSRAYGGSGLGLSIVKATMDRHGCACGVYNTPTGVCFWFELDLFQ